MKTKIIPFDLETAKKIQAGEIQGKIKQQYGEEVEILCWDLNEPNKLAVKHRYYNYDLEDIGIHVDEYNIKGEFYDRSDCMVHHDLVIEIPDNDPQFKVGDKVRIRLNDTHSYFMKQYNNCIGKIVGEDHEYFEVIVTGAFQCRFAADELELVEETEKHEFKPFDKVLVRDKDGEKWKCDIYSHKRDLSEFDYSCIGGWWKQCIPYEGNENLLDTTDKPKEE